MKATHSTGLIQGVFHSLTRLALSGAAALVYVSSAAAEPPPGPRDTTYKDFFLGLTVPEPVTSQQLENYLLVAGTDYEPFMQGFGSMKSAKDHCCGRGDCRYVTAMENADGSYTAFIPEGAYPKSDKRTVIVPPDAIIRDTSSLHVDEPPSAVLCASESLASVYCFHPAKTLTKNESPLLQHWMLATTATVMRRLDASPDYPTWRVGDAAHPVMRQ
jgi:hypothetical protein